MTNPTITDADKEAFRKLFGYRARHGSATSFAKLFLIARHREEATAEIEADRLRLLERDHSRQIELAEAQAEIARLRDIASEAEFLCARLSELDWSQEAESIANDFNAHVDPPLSRLSKALEALTKAGEA